MLHPPCLHALPLPPSPPPFVAQGGYSDPSVPGARSEPVARPLGGALEAASKPVRDAVEAVEGAASAATAAAANVFLAEGGERQAPHVPAEVAAANADRVGVSRKED